VSVVHNRIEVMHGVNLDQLGRRNPDHYGTLNLPTLERQIAAWADEIGIRVSCFQTNYEGKFVEHLHELIGVAGGVILNPGAWTHYSYAIHDALEIAALPAVEVHLSDVQARDQWRRISVIGGLCVATVSGKGPDGYREALEILKKELAG
jgi:3-dehydroquinate dehydratase-2